MTHLVACPLSNAVMLDRAVTISGQYGLVYDHCDKYRLNEKGKWFAVVVGDYDGWTTKFISELSKSDFLDYQLLNDIFTRSEVFRKNQEVGIIVGDSFGTLYSVFNDVTEINNLCCYGYSWPITCRFFNGNMDLNAARPIFSRFLNLFHREEERCFDIVRYREEVTQETFPNCKHEGVWYVETIQ